MRRPHGVEGELAALVLSSSLGYKAISEAIREEDMVVFSWKSCIHIHMHGEEVIVGLCGVNRSRYVVSPGGLQVGISDGLSDRSLDRSPRAKNHNFGLNIVPCS